MGRGCPEQSWSTCLKDNFKAFGATHGSTEDEPSLFGVPKLAWTEAAKVQGGVPWHEGVVKGAARFITSWHKDEEEASRQRAINRDKTKTKSSGKTAKPKGTGKGQRKDETAREEHDREQADRVARHGLTLS